MRRVAAFIIALTTAVVGCGSDDPASMADTQSDAAMGSDFVVGLSDVASGPPDIKLAPQAIGGICQTNANCLSNRCNTFPSGGYCTQDCGAGNPDCPDGATCINTEDSDGERSNLCLKACVASTQCRPGQVCPAQAGVCINACQPGGCNTGYECNEASGTCETAPPCQPEVEVCDQVDNDCDTFVDNGCGPTPTVPTTYTRLVDMGRVRVGGGGISRSLRFTPSPGAISFTIIALAEDDDSSYMGLYSLDSPGGVDLMGFGDPQAAPNRTYPSFGVYTALIPNSDAVQLVNQGRYEFTFVRYADDTGSAPLGHIWVYVIENLRADSQASTLDVNLWFAPMNGMNADLAQSDARFQSLIEAFSQTLTNMGITLGTTRYFDVTGPEASRYTIVDTGEVGDVDEHSELLALSRDLPADNTGVNFFFVQGFTGWGLLGKAGGIPGPPHVNGTYSSGVAVSLSEYFEYANEPLVIDLTAETMAHEMGHQLGLYHTTEQQGASFDHIQDTPECPAAQFDTNGDGLVDPQECIVKGGLNLMFWTSTLSSQLSVGQRSVIHKNPALRD